MGIDDDGVLGVGLWIDGVACRWDRSSSYDMITMGFPGLEGRWKNLRIPLVVIDHAWISKGNTFDDCLRVVAWSLRHAALGKHPMAREDTRAWEKKQMREERENRARIFVVERYCAK